MSALMFFWSAMCNMFRVVSDLVCLGQSLYLSGAHGVLLPILMPRFFLPGASTDGGPQR